MSPFDYLTRAEPFDPRGTPYAGDAQAQPLNALARIFGQEETAVDPTRRYGSANALKGTPDAYWSEAMMTPGQRTARNILASEPVQTVMNWANFAGPAMRAMPRPVLAPEGRPGGPNLVAPRVDGAIFDTIYSSPPPVRQIGDYNLVVEPGGAGIGRAHYYLLPKEHTAAWTADSAPTPRLGEFQVKPGQNGGIEVTNAFLKRDLQGKGIGKQVYDAIEADFKGTPLVPSPWNQLSDQAVSFWAKRNPEVLQRTRELQAQSYEGDRYPSRQIPAQMPRPVMAPEGPQGIRAYHGSPHDFDKFDMSKIGTGEGAQAYGHGLYFAESPKVAESYRSSVQYKPMPTATDPKDRATDLLWHARGNKDVAKYTARELYGRGEEGKAVVDAIEAHQATPGRMYEVRINASPEDFLDWDKPLSAQSEKVRKALVEFGQTPQDFDAAIAALRTKRENPISRGGDTSGYVKAIDDRIADLEARKTAYDVPAGQFLERLSYGRNDVKDQTSASARLREAGIPGIKYLDQQSRGTGEGTRNYVVFRDDIISILKKYGLAGLLAGGAAATKGQEAKASP